MSKIEGVGNSGDVEWNEEKRMKLYETVAALLEMREELKKKGDSKSAEDERLEKILDLLGSPNLPEEQTSEISNFKKEFSTIFPYFHTLTVLLKVFKTFESKILARKLVEYEENYKNQYLPILESQKNVEILLKRKSKKREEMEKIQKFEAIIRKCPEVFEIISKRLEEMEKMREWKKDADDVVNAEFLENVNVADDVMGFEIQETLDVMFGFQSGGGNLEILKTQMLLKTDEFFVEAEGKVEWMRNHHREIKKIEGKPELPNDFEELINSSKLSRDGLMIWFGLTQESEKVQKSELTSSGGIRKVLMNTIRQETDSLELSKEEQQKSEISNPKPVSSEIDEYIGYFCVLSGTRDKLLGLIEKRKDMKSGSESIDGYSELLETLDEEDSDDDDDADAEILNSTINLLVKTFLQKLDQKIAENEEFFKKLEILIPLAQKVRKRNEENLDIKTVASDLQLLKSETGNMLENDQNWRNIGPQYLENMNSSCNFEVTKTNETVQKILEKMMEKETGEGELEILKKSLNEEIDLLISKWKEDLDMPEILMDDDNPELTEKINNLSPGIRELVNHLNFLWQIEKQFLELFEYDFFGKNELIENYITMLSLDEEDKNLDLERKILEKSQKSENPEKWKKLKNAIEILRQFDHREHFRNIRETQTTLENLQKLILEIPKKRDLLIRNTPFFKTKNQQIEYSKMLKILDTAENFFKESFKNVLGSIENVKNVSKDSEDVHSEFPRFEGLENLQNTLNEYLKKDFKRSEESIENLKKSIIQETDNLISDCSERSESSGIFETLRKSQKELFETFDNGGSNDAQFHELSGKHVFIYF